MKNLVEVKNLKTYYSRPLSFFGKKFFTVKAVNDISFVIPEGKTVGLVGESGCGKTTAGKSILRLIEPTSGNIFFEGEDILKKTESEIRNLRKKMQIFFQDPYSSLNPHMTAEEIISEPLIIYKTYNSYAERHKRVLTIMNHVGLSSQQMKKYPHEFSGGQRQRIGIARALVLNPKLIIADEPVSALDVSIQSQIINLLLDLQEEFKLTYLFISHDLRIVEYISDYIVIMYLGKIVEIAPVKELYKNPMHPYTQSLLTAIPIPDPEYKKTRKLLEGDIPSPSHVPDGCNFHTRCPEAEEMCKNIEPALIDITDGYLVSCHHRRRA
ncbi:ATP-binding cassette domain-containing protein [Candidatus Desantisbacteria bacterium]|nr:ATP-binding cassette domain-containing protein [Candidatus Desantisbacteria bacterium]